MGEIVAGDNVSSVHDAIREALSAGGADVLREPKRLSSIIADLADPDLPETRVILKNCDEWVLSPFVDILPSPNAADIIAASKKVAYCLSHDRVIDEAGASRTAGELAIGIAEWLDIPLPCTFAKGDNTKDWVAAKKSPASSGADPAAETARAIAETGPVMHSASTPPRQSQAPSPTLPTQALPHAPVQTSPIQAAVQPPVPIQNPIQSNPSPNPSPSPKKRKLWPIIVIALAATFVVIPATIALVTSGGSDGGSTGSASEAVNEGAPVTISFDGNGATSGLVDDIESESGKTIVLPENTFSRDGCIFDGWSTFATSGKVASKTRVYEPGAKYPVDSEMTFYAVWELDPAVSEKMHAERQDFPLTEDGEFFTALLVRNDSDIVVDLEATFNFVDKNGATVESKTDDSWSIGPGDTALISSWSDLEGVEGVNHFLSASLPAGGDPLSSAVTSEVVSSSIDGMTVKVTNTSKTLPARIIAVVAYGTGSEQRFNFIGKSLEVEGDSLAPGESAELDFPGDLWGHIDYDIYLYGSMLSETESED